MARGTNMTALCKLEDYAHTGAGLPTGRYDLQTGLTQKLKGKPFFVIIKMCGLALPTGMRVGYRQKGVENKSL